MATRTASFEEQLAAFMGSIKHHESRGDTNAVSGHGARGLYQIMPSNWPVWAKEAGLSSNAPMTPANQERVTRHKMTEYFNRFKSWDAVAVAWFAGPDRAKRYVNGDDRVLGLSDGGATVQRYITQALNTMSSNLGFLPPEATRGGKSSGMEVLPDGVQDGLTVDRVGEGSSEPTQQEQAQRARAVVPRAEDFLRGTPTDPVAADRQQVLASLGSNTVPFLPQSPTSTGIPTVEGPGDPIVEIGSDGQAAPQRAGGAGAGQSFAMMTQPGGATVAGPRPPSQAFAQRRPADIQSVETPDTTRQSGGFQSSGTIEQPAATDSSGGTSTTGTTGSLPAGLGIDPLLNLATTLENTSGNLMGLGSDLSSIIDPALMASLGELGLSEDLGTLDTLEEATRLLLGSAEQRRRLQRGFEREQELTGANLSERGIFIRPSENEAGLVGFAAEKLGEQQGEALADFNAAVGDQFRGLLSGLGNTQLGNVGSLGGTLVSGITDNLQQALDQIQVVK